MAILRDRGRQKVEVRFPVVVLLNHLLLNAIRLASGARLAYPIWKLRNYMPVIRSILTQPNGIDAARGFLTTCRLGHASATRFLLEYGLALNKAAKLAAIPLFEYLFSKGTDIQQATHSIVQLKRMIRPGKRTWKR